MMPRGAKDDLAVGEKWSLDNDSLLRRERLSIKLRERWGSEEDVKLRDGGEIVSLREWREGEIVNQTESKRGEREIVNQTEKRVLWRVQLRSAGMDASRVMPAAVVSPVPGALRSRPTALNSD